MEVDEFDALESIEPQFFFRQKHVGYINSLSIDNVEHNLLLCGGTDSSVTVWDVSSEPDDPTNEEDGEDKPWAYKDIHTKPLCRLEPKASHKFGITKLEWWPFNNDMFVTGSYDCSVKVWDSEALEEVYSFDLNNKVYSFDINPLEEDGLVAVGLNHPLIRLLDLRAAGSAQSLKGHSSGSVCSVKWSPTKEYTLASGGSDGTVRIWDIRQANQQVANMDLMRTNSEQTLAPADFRRAHRAVCNGLLWHPNGEELLSLGLDNKARIWDLTDLDSGGVNKLINFGPLFQDRRQQTLDPCSYLSGNDDLIVFLPSDTGDVLMSQFHDGRLIRRLLPPGRDIRTNRQASIVSRGPNMCEFFSSTCDGSVIRWRPND